MARESRLAKLGEAEFSDSREWLLIAAALMFTNLNGKTAIYEHAVPVRVMITKRRTRFTNPDRLQEEARSMDNRGLFAAMFSMFFLACLAVGYVYVALALQTIAQKNKHGKRMAGMDSYREHHPDAGDRQEADLVDHPVFHPPREPHHVDNSVDGDCGGAPQAKRWGILLIIPVVNLIVPGYLAWSD